MKNIDVSIIIINYNSYELTKNAIDSLVKYSKGFSYEIILIDNASSDSSGDKLLNYFPQYNIFLNKDNVGFSRANNQALKIAKGQHVLFLNNDTLFRENTISVLLKYLKTRHESILIAPKLLNRDETLQYSTYRFQSLWLSFTTYFFLYSIFPKSKYFNRYYLMNQRVDEITEVEGVTGAFMLLKKEDVIAINGFDENFFFYGEDNDLCKRFRTNGGKIIYYPLTHIIHLKGGTKKTDWFHEKYHTISVLKLFNKHFPLYKRIFAYLFMYVGKILRIILLIAKYIINRKKNYLVQAKLKIKTLRLTAGSKL